MTRYRGSEQEIRTLDAFIGLMRAADRVSSRAHRDLSALRLSVSQFGVLEALYHRGAMYQKEIAAKILKSTGNITMVIDNLEKRGLVRRERNEDDRRFFTVRLTREGEDLIKGSFPDHVRRIVTIMSVLNDGELVLLTDICRKLTVTE